MTDEKENPTPEHDEAQATAEAEHATEQHEELAAHDEDSEPSLEDFKPTMPGNINPEVLQNIVVNLSIEVGRAQIKIKDLMRLTQGSVVELDRIAGEPLDLLVNNSSLNRRGHRRWRPRRFGPGDRTGSTRHSMHLDRALHPNPAHS